MSYSGHILVIFWSYSGPIATMTMWCIMRDCHIVVLFWSYSGPILVLLLQRQPTGKVKLMSDCPIPVLFWSYSGPTAAFCRNIKVIRCRLLALLPQPKTKKPFFSLLFRWLCKCTSFHLFLSTHNGCEIRKYLWTYFEWHGRFLKIGCSHLSRFKYSLKG